MSGVTVGKAIATIMKEEGVNSVYCVPGESYLGLIDAFYEEDGLALVATRHEGGAGFMAEATGKIPGNVGVVLVTRGPGVTNAAIAIHTAFQDGTPLVAIVGQVPQARRGTGAFQEMEIQEVFRSVAKWTVEIEDSSTAPALVRRAFKIAKSGRPGPVVVSLPENIDRATCDFRSSLEGAFGSAPPGPASGSQIGVAVEAIQEAKSVAIIVGAEVSRQNARKSVVRLAEVAGAGVYTSWRRFDAFPNDHRHYLGGLPVGMRADLLSPLREADLVIAIGTRLGDKTSLDFEIPSATQRLIYLGSSLDHLLGRDRMLVDLGAAITANVDLLAEGLTNGAKTVEVNLDERRKRLNRHRLRFENECTPTQSYGEEVDLEGVVFDFRRLLPRSAALVSDAGTFAGWLDRFYSWNDEATFYGPTCGAMGYAVPAAIGVKVATPERIVVAFVGDGGFAMTMSEVETAVRLKLGGLVFVVVNDSCYSTIRLHQERSFPGRQVATGLGTMRFAEIATGLGASGMTASSNAEFRSCFESAIQHDGPVVIDLNLPLPRTAAWAKVKQQGVSAADVMRSD